MARRARPMLFLPPLPPVQLRPRQRLVLGRSRTCDLVLADAAASRRHAEIAPARDDFVLRDLDSTNGTYVNGERIHEHTLKPGDCIQIGERAITFCQVEAAAGGLPGEEAETVVAGRPALEAFRGDLSEIPAFAVLQILELGAKTGLLHVDSPGGAGRLWINAGAPVHAEVQGRAGFEAALEIVRAGGGRFAFDPGATLPPPTITATMTQLLLEASRRLDERGRPGS